jgi:hypothetical protein
VLFTAKTTYKEREKKGERGRQRQSERERDQENDKHLTHFKRPIMKTYCYFFGRRRRIFFCIHPVQIAQDKLDTHV